MRFSPLEPQYIGAYLFSFDILSPTKRFGAMEHQMDKNDFFSANTTFFKSLLQKTSNSDQDDFFTKLSAPRARKRALKEYVGKLLV